jgi:hypothetical protein
MTPDTRIPLGGAILTCIAANGRVLGRVSQLPNITNENDKSIAVLIQYGGFDYFWASDLGGGVTDAPCTGRTTTQQDVESAVIKAISPQGASPMITDGGIDVLHVSHHGSESSTNATLMNFAAPAVALISHRRRTGGKLSVPAQDRGARRLDGECPVHHRPTRVRPAVGGREAVRLESDAKSLLGGKHRRPYRWRDDVHGERRWSGHRRAQ